MKPRLYYAGGRLGWMPTEATYDHHRGLPHWGLLINLSVQLDRLNRRTP